MFRSAGRRCRRTSAVAVRREPPPAGAMTCASTTAPGVVVASVRPGGPAAAAGGRAGDRIVAVNGQPLRDVIDFPFHAGEARLRLTLSRAERTRAAVLARRGPDLGLELEPPRPSEIAT